MLREARALSQLDHPNICRIHDYIESGDVDLLVLEYIDGTTLQRRDRRRSCSRGEKLRIAIAIADVLVAAHRAGIVHRDLKPENVMLTKTGEVKVLDFGLARWLQRARASARHRPTAAPRSCRSSTARRRQSTTLADDRVTTRPRRSSGTAVGITLGTPLYMSPEQARGETLTPASDMFSFGLLLQALFTGNEPHPMGLTAREVILRVARGETNPVERRAARRHGADQPPQAVRARRPPDGGRGGGAPAVHDRQAAAHRAPRHRDRAGRGGRTIGGWRYTVDLQRERAKAVAAQGEAEKRRAQAEDLIEFMLGDLRKKLEPVGTPRHPRRRRRAHARVRRLARSRRR